MCQPVIGATLSDGNFNDVPLASGATGKQGTGGVQTSAPVLSTFTLSPGTAPYQVTFIEPNDAPAATGGVIRTLTGHTAAVNQAVFTPDGTEAVSASNDGTLILWNLSDGTIIRQLQMTETSPMKTVAISPASSDAFPRC